MKLDTPLLGLPKDTFSRMCPHSGYLRTSLDGLCFSNQLCRVLGWVFFVVEFPDFLLATFLLCEELCHSLQSGVMLLVVSSP